MGLDIIISGCSEEVRKEVSRLITTGFLAENYAGLQGEVTIYSVADIEEVLDERTIITDLPVCNRLISRGWEVL